MSQIEDAKQLLAEAERLAEKYPDDFALKVAVKQWKQHIGELIPTLSEEPRKIKVYHNAGTVTIRIPADIVKDIGITAETEKVAIRRPDKNRVELVF